jgi:hypothetical protein
MCKVTLEDAACLATKARLRAPSPKVYVPNTNSPLKFAPVRRLVGPKTEAVPIEAKGDSFLEPIHLDRNDLIARRLLNR